MKYHISTQIHFHCRGHECDAWMLLSRTNLGVQLNFPAERPWDYVNTINIWIDSGAASSTTYVYPLALTNLSAIFKPPSFATSGLGSRVHLVEHACSLLSDKRPRYKFRSLRISPRLHDETGKAQLQQPRPSGQSWRLRG